MADRKPVERVRYATVAATGTISGKPEVRYLTPNGTAYVEFTLEIGPERFDVIAYGTVAEQIGNFAEPGMRIHVGGRLREQTWKTQVDGERRRIVIEAEAVSIARTAVKDEP